ncbi:uncharacterized protein LOC122847871 [Aphidius gifuensis]|uniref:uncharacterized protein LOC122847871 n=1 Tax=Aphidius gifuensis TaxID=684658 RepID=UPI001CDBA272|nr:uncharacterized protein LOC122847871 [Aphidius gifuensis]
MRRKRRKKRRNRQRHRRKLKNYNKKILKHHLTSQVDKSQLLIPNIQPRSRKVRATVKNSTSLLKKRQEYYDNINKLSDYNSNYLNYASTDTNLEISTDDMMLLDDYKLSDNKPIGAYSFNRYPDKYYSYNSALQDPQIQYQNYDNNELINTRTISSFKNQITTQTSLIANHTTAKQINHQSINLKKNESVIIRDNETSVQTKQVANEILNEIIEQLEEIKIERNSNNHRDGLPCKITGLWKTSQAGVDLMIKITNHTLNITIEKSHDVDDSNGLKIINNTWNITGHVAFKRGAPFYLIASNNHVKSLAAFVGACKVCQGVDTIEGVWTVTHEPKSCRDFQISTNIYNDIFYKKIDNINNKNTSGKYNETLYDTE